MEERGKRLMNTALVSVAMITYNHAKYIKKAIEGVLKQRTSFRFELVIGEDCSTDNTRDIVMQYQKEYPEIIRMIVSEANVGAKKNWVRTIGECRGNYIAFCEGDDFWQNYEKLQKQADYLEQHPDVGMVYADFDWYDMKRKRIQRSFFKSLGERRTRRPKINDIARGNAGILTCTVMARRKLVTEIMSADPYLHQSNAFIMADSQLWAEIALKARIHCLEEVVAFHNILEESLTQSKNRSKEVLFGISNSLMFLYLCEKHDLPSEIRNFHEKTIATFKLELAFIENNKELAESVKRDCKWLGIRDMMLYYGVKYSLGRVLVLGLKYVVTKARKGSLWAKETRRAKL